MPVVPINSFEEFTKIINGDKPVVIDFWATWCGPCRQISPIFEKLSNLEDNSGVGFYKVDVDEQERISAEVGIKAMPTFTMFYKGEKGAHILGADPRGLTTLVGTAVKTSNIKASEPGAAAPETAPAVPSADAA